MNYEIEIKLNNKVDRWELSNIQNKNRELKSQIQELERKISNLENVNSNRHYAFERLLNIMVEHPQFSDLQNEIYELKGNL